jgi:arginine utilization protein RocB
MFIKDNNMKEAGNNDFNQIMLIIDFNKKHYDKETSSIDWLTKSASDILNYIKQNTTLYAFLYNPMIHESSSQTVSIHRTREGAEKAMEEQMTEEKKRYKEWYENDKSYKLQFPFNWNKNWKIEEILIFD